MIVTVLKFWAQIIFQSNEKWLVELSVGSW